MSWGYVLWLAFCACVGGFIGGFVNVISSRRRRYRDEAAAIDDFYWHKATTLAFLPIDDPDPDAFERRHKRVAEIDRQGELLVLKTWEKYWSEKPWRWFAPAKPIIRETT